MTKKRYAQVGIGGRARMYYTAIADTFKETSELVAFCDINRTRMEYANEILETTYNYPQVPRYGAEDFVSQRHEHFDHEPLCLSRTHGFLENVGNGCAGRVVEKVAREDKVGVRFVENLRAEFPPCGFHVFRRAEMHVGDGHDSDVSVVRNLLLDDRKVR